MSELTDTFDGDELSTPISVGAEFWSDRDGRLRVVDIAIMEDGRLVVTLQENDGSRQIQVAADVVERITDGDLSRSNSDHDAYMWRHN